MEAKDNFFRDYVLIFFIAIIILIIAVLGITFITNSILETKWDKLKNDCELSSILDNGNYKYVCQIESNPTTVIYNKLDAQHWEKFKIKNNCRLKINLNVINKKQWLCDNNLNFNYDDN